MGICISLRLSKSITQEEWVKVYEEALGLAKWLPLATIRKVPLHGINTTCLVRTEEYTREDYWAKSGTCTLFSANGDYHSLRTAEEFCLKRDISNNKEYDVISDAGDAMLHMIPYIFSKYENDKRFENVYYMWGCKTQGEPYHIYILSIACLLAARLGNKISVEGDITRGQCKRAVEIVNKYLEVPIEMPDQCYVDRLYKRISSFPITEVEKLELLLELYLGTKDAAFGDSLRDLVPAEVLDDYWLAQFACAKEKSGYLDSTLGDYLRLGFALEDVFKYANFVGEEGCVTCEEFIKCLMDKKLHLREKNCSDALEIDQEGEAPYSIFTLLAQTFLSGARNKKIDRYIPIENIREVLNAGLGDRCAVNEIVDAYLDEESTQLKINLRGGDRPDDRKFEDMCRQDPAEVFNQTMDLQIDAMREEEKQYDITSFDELIYYKKGNLIAPKIDHVIKHICKFLKTLLSEPHFEELSSKDAHPKCKWMILINRYFCVRDVDWEKVFTDIEQNPASFSRYYPLFRIEISNENSLFLCTALLINDDFYEYSKALTDSEEEKEC